MAELKFEIKEHIGTVSESSKGWTKELNIVSWNGATPKFHQRLWTTEQAKMGKGLAPLFSGVFICIDCKLKYIYIVDNINKK